MRVSQKVKKILQNYESDSPAVKANLARMLCTGRLAGTGKMVILPVDQGFEHGPVRSFGPNPAGYDPEYHAQLAVDAGLNAYASVLGMIEHGASQAEITAYDAASTGVFDEWWSWFRLTLAQMPRHLGGGGAE